ncbi:ABC transporter permease [Alkaliphilus peptidifermentans]|uniref:Spermidine/putrescine transport system permease protein n=1 Tax=Alkaliphilus peptidifermentans DSM 18978 TaxID=1120976 RepID=A0A1G5IVJ6_9FIRM|nr:ABC transporter permease [Alkaliphilus peptidifermentans]SCY79639.1 spermidine/putrescine transport system permease protein [Alkaliphilus peptidifermentans DSM 18978]
MKEGRISSPYIIWMTIFIVFPILLILFFGITIRTDEGFKLSLENFQRFFEPIYLLVLWRSIRLAFISTVICLILGYPMAMILANKDLKMKNTLVLLFVIPMWMNFLLRTYAWMTLLERGGIINSFLSLLRIPPINLLYTEEAVILGMVYNFLPFMVLPIYSVLIKIDKSLLEAAEDLGADSYTVLRKVIFPLSIPGVISGITMVFMPAVTTFVISRLLGGGQFTLIGNLIEQQFLFVGDWNFGSAISIVMIILILISMGFMSKYEKENEGAGLW